MILTTIVILLHIYDIRTILQTMMKLITCYLLSFALAVSSFHVRPTKTVSEQRQHSLTSLEAQKPGYGPAIPPFRFSDNVIGSTTAHPTYNNNNKNSNGNSNNYVNGYNAPQPPQQQQQQSPPPQQLQQQEQSTTTTPSTNMMYAKPTPSSSASYLDQLQQQQQQQQQQQRQEQPSSPPPTPSQQQSVVHNDFSEYERQLRQLTKGQ